MAISMESLAKEIEQLRQSINPLTQAVQQIGPMGQAIHRHELILQPAKSSSILSRRDAELLYSPKVMQSQLGSGGVAPLSLNGLAGAAAQTQSAAIPQVPSLPQLGDPSYRPGSGIVVNVPGQGNFRRGTSGWEPLAPTAVVAIAQPAVGGGGVGAAGTSYAGFSQQSTSAPWFGTPTGARAIAAIYQNLTGLPLFLAVSVTLSTSSPASIGTDSTSTPTTVTASVASTAITTLTFELSDIILPNNYYLVSAGTLVKWTEKI